MKKLQALKRMKFLYLGQISMEIMLAVLLI